MPEITNVGLNIAEKSTVIWNVADMLRGPFKPHEYGLVIISNPPFGIDWKREQKAVEAEAKLGENGRFAPGLPKISDGQQLFVLNGLKKLAEDGKMAIVQNGSPLFSGDAGSGPSEIRRYILENDWLDAIISHQNVSLP